MKPNPWRGEFVPTIIVDPVTGKGVRDNGRPLDVTYEPQGGRLSTPALLHTAVANDARRVFLTGPKPTSSAWLDEAAEGFAPAGHFYELRDPCGRWDGPGGRVEVRRVASFFGEGDYTPDDAREAMRLFATILRTTTKGRVGLVAASPSAVGQSLWADSLGVDGRERLDVQLDDDLANLIRSTSPQHREEVIGRCYDGCDEHLPTPRTRLAELHYVDGVFMYAACVRELGVAPAALVESPRLASAYWEANPYARARYLVRFTVPEGWTRAGLLPVKHPNGRNWHYPNRPGVVGEGWVDAAELFIAAREGWSFDVLGFIRYEQGARPLDRFAERVVRMRELAEAERSNRPANTMAAAAFRSLFIRTVGAFHSRGRERSYVVPLGQPLPAGVERWETRDDGSRLYTASVPLRGNAAAFARPELSSQVWARARARVTERMMTLDPADVVAVWGDAMYLASDPGWQGERPGEFRVKAAAAGPISRPKNLAELLRLRDRMGAE